MARYEFDRAADVCDGERIAFAGAQREGRLS
jgi:hypothetical protein